VGEGLLKKEKEAKLSVNRPAILTGKKQGEGESRWEKKLVSTVRMSGEKILKVRGWGVVLMEEGDGYC